MFNNFLIYFFSPGQHIFLFLFYSLSTLGDSLVFHHCEQVLGYLYHAPTAFSQQYSVLV